MDSSSIPSYWFTHYVGADAPLTNVMLQHLAIALAYHQSKHPHHSPNPPSQTQPQHQAAATSADTLNTTANTNTNTTPGTSTTMTAYDVWPTQIAITTSVDGQLWTR